MNTGSNIILTVLFGGMGAWLFAGWFRTRNKISIYDKKWSASRILFIVAGVLSLATMYLYTSVLDFIRIGAMLLCIIAYMLTRDGIGDEGVSCNGSFYPWNVVRSYDFQEEKKSFYAVFSVWDKQSKKNGNYQANINFDLKDEEAVKELLKKKIGKRYVRRKK
ncbi:MAG: hypothetical protein IJ130_09435 [Solobacterium sp.]|nr:hypothetical protein [Solobacterium sp.]